MEGGREGWKGEREEEREGGRVEWGGGGRSKKSY